MALACFIPNVSYVQSGKHFAFVMYIKSDIEDHKTRKSPTYSKTLTSMSCL